MSHRRGPRSINPRWGSPCKSSVFLEEDTNRGYTVHNGKQWVSDTDPEKPKRLMQHRPDVRYISPTTKYEQRQFKRWMRKEKEKQDAASNDSSSQQLVSELSELSQGSG